jgi:hypothetical protein
MLTFEEKMLKGLGLNKDWFSQTTKCVPMISCIYFTATRNVTVFDIVDVFENILNIGIVFKEYINIVPVLNKNYNHVFFKIQWNDTIETANFVNEILIHSSVKVHHNRGYWVCRMSKHPLKMRISKRRIKVASFDYDDSDSESEYESQSQEQNVTIQVKEIEEATEEVSTNVEEDRVSTNGEDKVSTNGEDKVSTNGEDRVSTNGEDKVSTNGEEEEDFYVINEEVKEEEINSVVQ